MMACLLYTSRHYKEICKERGIDPNAKKEPEMAVLDAEANQQEALFLIDDATYLHIQPCDSGWDYTLYDVASMKELDDRAFFKLSILALLAI